MPSVEEFWGLYVAARSPPPPGCVNITVSVSDGRGYGIGDPGFSTTSLRLHPPLSVLGPALPCWLSDSTS